MSDSGQSQHAIAEPGDDPIAQVCDAMCSGKPVPAWLAQYVRWGVAAVRDRFESESITATRNEQRLVDEKILATAQFLASWFKAHTQHELAQQQISRLRTAGLSSEAISGLTVYLPELVEAARSVPQPRDGGGRDRISLNPEAFSAHQMCAAVVGFAWGRIHETEPPHTSSAVQNACSALWAVAGLPQTRWGTNDSGWRPHVAEFKKQTQTTPPTWQVKAFLEAAQQYSD
jgi:hypothetical protein